MKNVKTWRQYDHMTTTLSQTHWPKLNRWEKRSFRRFTFKICGSMLQKKKEKKKNSSQKEEKKIVRVVKTYNVCR